MMEWCWGGKSRPATTSWICAEAERRSRRAGGLAILTAMTAYRTLPLILLHLHLPPSITPPHCGLRQGYEAFR